MADNIKYRFIQNVGDYFPSGYFSEDFIDKVQKASGVSADEMTELCSPYVQLRREYDSYKNYIVNSNPRVKDAILHTHQFNDRLLQILGYAPESEYRFYALGERASEPAISSAGSVGLGGPTSYVGARASEPAGRVNNEGAVGLGGPTSYDAVVPVRQVLSRGGNTSMLVMEMQHLIPVGDQQPSGLFEQRYNVEGDTQLIRHQQYYAGQWSEVFTLPDELRISPAVINKAIDALFLLPPERRPHYILMMAGNTIFLLNQEKWNRGAYLQFSLDELFSQASISAFRKYYALFHLLICKDTLAADSETVLMDRLVEESYKSAYEVTKDLKNGVVLAVESLANEALYWWKQNNSVPVEDYTDDTFEAKVKDDCLTIVYRLLFIFYAESRDELDILPTNDEVYNQGYSLEMLRDLEKVPLISETSRNGFFIDDSLRQLFRLLSTGYHENRPMGDKSFTVTHIDSPLFNNAKLNYLGDVRIRNIVWQEIIQALSLSHRDRQVGRISYANLGVNQLGSVYESLLAYRGFYAEEDYIEVHKAGKPEEGTFLVPYSRMDDFEPNEILCDKDERPIILKKGTFVYRLNGRDRQKSASYYTPEILTRSTVKYTLKAVIDEVAEGKRKATELLDLKILEPAMGAAAFQNEVINQLAEAYLTYRQQELRLGARASEPANSKDNVRLGGRTSYWRIAPDHYRDELQKVKAYIATHNVYGVDLNPTAIELGKLSLWLNVIHKDMETPFFSNRLALGNAVIGAWLKVYSREEFAGKPDKTNSKKPKLLPTPWWEKAPHKIKFFKNRVNRSVNEVYHFLLPDKAMLAVRNIAEQKKAHPEETTRMNTLIKNWTEPITDRDFNILKRLSGKIDLLLKEYFQFQQSVENLTQNKGNIWGAAGTPSLNLDTYAEKERLNDVRYRHDNAYFRLKMVMDYWCALWFWEYDRTADLPTREEYWNDIEAMLNVSDQELDASTTRALLGARASEPANNESANNEPAGRVNDEGAVGLGGPTSYVGAWASEPTGRVDDGGAVGLGGPTSYRLSFMERDKYIHITNNILPHWYQRGKVQFVTFRLADSLPQTKLEELTAYKEQWLQQHPKPWDSKTEELYNHDIRSKVDKWLDQGHGSCLLAREDVRQIVIDSLLYYHEKKYVLWHFVIMPNHVHLLLSPIGDADVVEVLGSVKRFTANAINKALKRKGELWQAYVFDRLVRDERNYEQYVNYINNNPRCLPVSSYSLGAWASEPTNNESANNESAVGLGGPTSYLGAWASEPTGRVDDEGAVGLGGPTSYVVQEETRPYNTDADSEIIQLSKEQVLAETKGFTDNFLHDSQRYKIVMEYAARYHFFHPMLEFLEVFWLRDGFDIICGNPPWIKLEFDEVGIISEKYPEVAIRKMSAPDVRKKRDELFATNPDLEKLYRSEEIENVCSGVFLNAYQNYPLLIGQQTNLYKCVLTNGMEMMGTDGYMGLLTPESIYDDPKGQPLRRELYKHLQYHFQYQNELRLFAEVDHHTVYGGQLLQKRTSSPPRFASLSNLFHPSTVDACFAHDGHGLCGGIKDEDGNWNTSAHKERIVHFGEEELKILSEAFEGGVDWESVKLTSIHSEVVVAVLEKLSKFPSHLKDVSQIIVSEGLHETNSVDKGIMKRNTCFPNIEKCELIYSGPHFFCGNPIYKTPRAECLLNSDYDTLDLSSLTENYAPRTNYTPTIPIEDFKGLITGFANGQDSDGKTTHDNWTDYYKVGFRRMIGSTSERSLSGAILLPNCLHIGAVVSVTFKKYNQLIEFTALTSSLVMDFYVKVLKISDIHANRVLPFPLGIADKYKSALFVRTLMLNCLTRHYADLWEEVWRDDFRNQTWSIDDDRLHPFCTLQRDWSWETPLRNYFERRQALVEIDVIAAMALGLSLQDLEMIYTIQFPVLQQNENDTWYDRKGNIVFTCSKGLTGVGVDRPVWEQIRNMKEGETYDHTIEKSELYRGQHVTYYAPFTRQDRIEDYRTAWAHFEKVFDNQKEERD